MDRRSFVKRGIPILGLLLVGVLILYADWVRRVPAVQNPQGDAVVVHAGQGERLVHAVGLMEQGAAPTLVVMFGEERFDEDRFDDDQFGSQFCSQTEPYEIICPTPEVATTIGEAVELGKLVEERGWTTVVTVTSDYHLRRATYLDSKCGNVDAIGSGAGQGITRSQAVGRIAREMLAMVQARLTRC